jgi:hypothetical protein
MESHLVMIFAWFREVDLRGIMDDRGSKAHGYFAVQPPSTGRTAPVM